MGWKECKKMDEKLKFIARYLEGEKIAPLCKEFGITRHTANKLIDCYKMMGQYALPWWSKNFTTVEFGNCFSF